MRATDVSQRTALSVLSFLSTSQRARLADLEEYLGTPKIVLMPCLKALEAAEYITLETKKEERHVPDSITITSSGQAFFLESVGRLNALVGLLDEDHQSKW